MRFEYTLRPGDLVVISMLLYDHYAIVSDWRSADGKLMLISLRAETGTALEEPYDDVVRGREIRLLRRQSPLCRHEILERARSLIGKCRYHVLLRNCEHFANWACGFEVRSRQVETVINVCVVAVIFWTLTNGRQTA